MIKNTDNKNLKSLDLGIDETIEDITRYGEFISSYFAWVGLDKQKEIVNRLENMTNKNHQQITDDFYFEKQITILQIIIL